MRLLHGFDAPDAYRGGCVTIGNFDGVHRGHQSMLERLVHHAQATQGPAVVLTFDPHPIHLLRPHEAPPRLSSLVGKAELLAGFGVETVIAYPTDQALLELSPQQFFSQIVVDQLMARAIVEGPNFQFGHQRRGNVESLAELCRAAHVTLEIVPPVEVEGSLVSSSRIRALIADGAIAEANGLLGHRYAVQGIVESGAQRGRQIGFPTANLGGIKTLLPGDGVYAGSVLLDGIIYAAAVNVGTNPTFREDTRKTEVHLLDFSGDLYGRELRVEFWAHLRTTQPFSDLQGLREQLQSDMQQVQQLITRDQ